MAAKTSSSCDAPIRDARKVTSSRRPSLASLGSTLSTVALIPSRTMSFEPSAVSTSASESDFSVLTSAQRTSAPLMVICATSVTCTPCELNTESAANSSAPDPDSVGSADGHQICRRGHARSVEARETRLRLRVVLTGAKLTYLGDVDVATRVEPPECGERHRDRSDRTRARQSSEGRARSATSSRPPSPRRGTVQRLVRASRRSSRCPPFDHASREVSTHSTSSCERCH